MPESQEHIELIYIVDGETEADATANLAVQFREYGVINLEACRVEIESLKPGRWEAKVTVPLDGLAVPAASGKK